MRYGVIAVYAGMFLFGVIYAFLVNWMRRRQLDEGFASLQVIFGVSVTLLGCRVIELMIGDVTVVQVFIAFACSGFPMTAESIGDYLIRRSNGRKIFGDMK